MAFWSLTVFMAGLLTMVVELVAGRVVARYLGQSLYTWAGILATILGGLAAGNALGGRLADRAGGGRLMGAKILGGAALATAAVLPLNRLAGLALEAGWLPWGARIVLHLAAVFGPPAVAMGMISPVAAERVLRAGGPAGRRFGWLYAWGTAGSLVGTALTGFVLVASLPVSTIVLLASAVWMGLGAVHAAAAGDLADSGAVLQASNPAQRCGMDETRALERPAAGLLAGAGWLSTVAAVGLGMAIMGVELAAGRVVAREFGQSLYGWTSVIGVFLAGLSLGSWAGGAPADRRPPGRALSLALCAASLALLLVFPAMTGVSGWRALWTLYWPGRILAHTALVFGPVAVALGACVPALARLALAEEDRRGAPAGRGRRAGSVYAWISVGSVGGALLTGFVLVEAAGVRGVFGFGVGLLAALSVAVPGRAGVALAWPPVLGLSLWLVMSPGESARRLAARLNLRRSPDANEIHYAESVYSSIAVRRDVHEPGILNLYLDRLKHSGIRLSDPGELLYDYERIYAAIAGGYYPPPLPVKALMIGGGGYVFPRRLETLRPGSGVDVIEIDPAVTHAAQVALGLARDTRLNVIHGDAGRVVDGLARRARAGEAGAGGYDLAFGDAFNDCSVPFHLVTLEFTRKVKEVLKPDGVYLINLIDSLNNGRFLGAVVNTCRAVFPSVSVIGTHTDGGRRDTFVIVCSGRPPPPDRWLEGVRLRSGVRAWRVEGPRLARVEELSRGVVLTDDYAPVENLLAALVALERASDDSIHLRRAVDLLERGELDECIRECRVVLEQNPALFSARDMLAICLARKGDPAGAVEEWRKAILARPDVSSMHFNLGYAYSQMGELERAVAAWEEALRLDPGNAKASNNLAVAREFLQASD